MVPPIIISSTGICPHPQNCILLLPKTSEWLDEYLLSKPGAIKEYKAEWEWWRYMVGGKMFAATMHPSEKYEPEYADKDLLVLKCEPILAELLRKEYSDIIPGFYMNKVN